MKPEPRIQDVAPLKTGGALVALGDGGVHHYARDGRLLHSYELPSLEHPEERLVELPALAPQPSGMSEHETVHALLRAEHVVDGAAPPLTREPVYLIDNPKGNEPWGSSRLQDLKGTWAHPFPARAARFVGSGRWAAVLLRHPTRAEVVCFDLETRRPCWNHPFMARLPDYASPSGPVPSVDA